MVLILEGIVQYSVSLLVVIVITGSLSRESIKCKRRREGPSEVEVVSCLS
jgi:hypothetical protein